MPLGIGAPPVDGRVRQLAALVYRLSKLEAEEEGEHASEAPFSVGEMEEITAAVLDGSAARLPPSVEAVLPLIARAHSVGSTVPAAGVGEGVARSMARRYEWTVGLSGGRVVEASSLPGNGAKAKKRDWRPRKARGV